MATYSAWNAFHKTTSTEPCPPNCTICLEPLTITTSDTTSAVENAVTINLCGHIFGCECLTTWMHEHNTCPVCRIEYFSLPEAVIESNVGSDRPQHFILGVYTLGNSSLEVSINSTMQSMTRLQVDAEEDPQDDQNHGEQLRRSGRSNGGVRRFLA